MKLNLTKKAKTFLEKLPPKQFKQVANTIFKLMSNPEPHDSKKLKGHPLRRVDIGEYRVVYSTKNDTLNVFVVGKRNDGEVYRNLKHKY